MNLGRNRQHRLPPKSVILSVMARSIETSGSIPIESVVMVCASGSTRSSYFATNDQCVFVAATTRERKTENEPPSAAMNTMRAHQLQSEEVAYVNEGESRQEPPFVDQSTPSISLCVYVYVDVDDDDDDNNYGCCCFF